MLHVLRHLLLVLIATALVTGGSAYRPARAAAPMAGMPCAMMVAGPAMDHGRPAMPCKDTAGVCIGSFGCVVAAGLPARIAAVEPAKPSLAVRYWSLRLKLAGLARQPEPLPPRTA